MEIEMKNTFVSKWAVALCMITFLVLRLNYTCRNQSFSLAAIYIKLSRWIWATYIVFGFLKVKIGAAEATDC